MNRPTGTVTFLFTDIVGSTRRWEGDPAGMRDALAAHDAVLRSAIESHAGWLFKHTGDGAAAAFKSAHHAVEAAVQAQRHLALPVRMGIATGEAFEDGADYFGPVVNRAARVMAAGHGGQIVVASSTAMMLNDRDLVDLGEHRLRDLSAREHLYQVRADGLGSVFPPLRTVDAVPGNLSVQTTSFIGREIQLKEVIELVGDHRLVTLTGVGGVGKTRLAVQAAAHLVTEFPDGVWLVELASLSDQAAVPDAVATALGITPQAGDTVAVSIARALSGRHMLIVVDNCEHLLDAAAALIETILRRTQAVHILATSREGLRAEAEQLWPVPSLDVQAGAASPAVELFIDRARAVHPALAVDDAAETSSISDICQRLDGIPLAIELAAARMVSMSATDIRDRLGDRFRLLSGSRRGLERHHTLWHAIAWSYDLLDTNERAVLNRCAVFADGFDLDAACAVADGELDEYALLDVLDSLVRKSLVNVERTRRRVRYEMLETIREFAADQLTVEGAVVATRARHAAWFAAEVVARWQLWEGPRQREAVEWAESEFANLRAAFWWALDHDLEAAAAIAAHTMHLAWTLHRFEPVGWADEVLAQPRAAELAVLPRLYGAAGFCLYTGRIDDAVDHSTRAVALQDDPRYTPFSVEWTRTWQAMAERSAGRLDRFEQICRDAIRAPGGPPVWVMATLLYALPEMGPDGAARARAIADEALTLALERGNVHALVLARLGYSRAFAADDLERARTMVRQALADARTERLSYLEALVLREAARLEAVHGRGHDALRWFDSALDSFHRAGNLGSLTPALAYLSAFFERTGRPDVAATVYGTITLPDRKIMGLDLATLAEKIQATLGQPEFDQCVAAGEAMDVAGAVHYARAQIERSRRRASGLL
jgi:predicted ATPase